MNKALILLLSFLLTCTIAHDVKTKANPLTAAEVQKLTRVSQGVATPDGKFIVYVIRNWVPQDGKVYTHLEYIEIATKKTGVLTDPTKRVGDSSPAFSNSLGNTLFFLSSRSGKSQIWTLVIPDTPSEQFPEATQLTDYPVDIISFKLASAGNAFAFNVEVYTSCGDDLDCTSKRDDDVKARGSNTYAVYDSLIMRHWDHWNSGKLSHIFVQKLTSSINLRNASRLNTPKLNGKPLEMMLKMETNSPVGPFGGSEMYDISPDGLEVAFTGADRTHDEAWNTGWKTYVSQVGDASTTPEHITGYTKARTTNPHYSPDGSKIGILLMDRVGLESDKLHIEVYNRATKEVTNITGSWDRSVIDYFWDDEVTILATATDFGTNKLYSIKLNQSSKTNLVDLDSDNVSLIQFANINAEDISSTTILGRIPTTTSFILSRTSYTQPTDIWIFETKSRVATQLTNFNPILSGFELVVPDSFQFPGGNGDPVQGWIFKPINFDSSKKYPLAFLIHGGPEGSWTSSFGYGWNPQLWASHGYAVVMINFHGSVGQGQKYTDLIINNWGGLPYQDLMLGFDYVLATYKYIDGNRACAAGGSYGGYMANWIQGNTDKFKCIICHDGVFSNINMAYATDELWFPFAENCPLDKTGCKPYDKDFREGYFKYSPETLVNNWKTPELVIQGSKDYRIPNSEAISIFTALQLKGVPSRLLFFDEENHWTLKAENSIKWYEEVLGWMDKWTTTKQEVSENNAEIPSEIKSEIK